jgi:SAM-dependent methyltransferase
MPDPKSRFSTRVDDYVKYRPGYPMEILDLLADECGLNPDSVIADIGSGTGMLSRLFLDNGNAVVGVEPNREMRAAAERMLAAYARFNSLDAGAEATRLPPHSMDFMLAGQAFHWFDRAKTREEWLRVLKPEGWAALIWNDRRIDSTPFLAAYEAALREFAADYEEASHRNIQDDALMQPFFGGDIQRAHFDNFQRVDLDGLVGRVASASYCPERGSSRFSAMTKRLGEIFKQHARNGRVTFEYDTIMYYGHLQ